MHGGCQSGRTPARRRKASISLGRSTTEPPPSQPVSRGSDGLCCHQQTAPFGRQMSHGQSSAVCCASTMRARRTSAIGLLAILLLTVAAGTVSAGTVRELDPIGFSDDGRRFAFQQFGVMAGSGEAFAELYVVDVAANAYLGTALRFSLPGGEAEEARWAGRERAQDLLASHGIRPGRLGRRVYSRPLTDLGPAAPSARFDTAPVPFGRFRDYEVTLRKTAVTPAHCASMTGPFFRVEVTLVDHKRKRRRVLQADRTVPASRGCPIAYRVQEVYVLPERDPARPVEGSIVVFLDVSTPSVEGPDHRLMAVTGLLER